MNTLDLGGRLAGDVDALDAFSRVLAKEHDEGGYVPRRVNLKQETVEQDLAKVVLSLVDLVRQLLERQAARRVNAGSLTDEEVERLGETFLKLDRKMAFLRDAFGLQREDLNLSLGPLESLLGEQAGPTAVELPAGGRGHDR